ncbi:MAG: Acylphosphatase [Methanosaeta sp. PtaU1.Bin112]|nr:MAG: Acylphosphatase [Methanosaeta sp. PtaU1.Bin112]
MPRLTAFVSGMVQKTGYRSRVVILANAFGLSGYVQNLPSGKVKIVAEGEKTDLIRFLNCLTIRDALIDVQSVENEISADTGEFTGFEKMVSSGETDQRLDRAADLLKDLIVVTKEVVVELKATHEDIKGVRDEVKGAREDIKGVRDEVKAAREDIKGVRDEVKGAREDIKGVRDEVKGAREDIKGVNVAVQNVCQAVNNIGNALSEKIDDTRDEILNEVKELRSDLKDDLKERLVRMDADISQIKAKCGL